MAYITILLIYKTLMFKMFKIRFFKDKNDLNYFILIKQPHYKYMNMNFENILSFSTPFMSLK